MITEVRKKKISKVTGELAQLLSSGNITQLEELATVEDLPVYYDDYEEAFDGMLLYDNKDFHIHINHTKGNQPNSKRGRFTLAHELGHYFIDEHRLGLKSGSLKPHGSLTELKDKGLIELEADYFASCLLMPEFKFKSRSALTKKFSLATITDLSDSFQASIVSTVIRFSEVGTHEIMAVFSRNNIVEWYARSKDFPQWPFRFKVHGTVPPITVAGEFYTKKDSKHTGIEKVSADDWFFPFENDDRADRQMYEQCYYSESYDYVISLIWFE
jgi:Zn-dependent peptidase ImmA (M78 family)